MIAWLNFYFKMWLLMHLFYVVFGCTYLVVVSVYLCFAFAWMFVWCKECWLVSLEGWEAYMRGLEVFRVQKHLTSVFWMYKGLFVKVECWKACLKPFKVAWVEGSVFCLPWVWKGLCECFECNLKLKNISFEWLESAKGTFERKCIHLSETESHLSDWNF